MSSDDDDPKLPQDVAVEILKRLPVRSLLRFRCVCRSWRSTIHRRPSFRGPPLEPLRSRCHQSSLTLPSPSQIEIPFVTPPNNHLIVDSCNGLICIAEISTNVCDQRTSNDYKIVRILYCMDNHSGCFGRTMSPVKIYSPSTDSWRSLECETVVILNGNLHWSTFKFNDMCLEGRFRSIVLFDVTHEVFDEIALPEEVLHIDDRITIIVCVVVLNDLLAVFYSHGRPLGHHESHSDCSVWVSGMVIGFGGFTWNDLILWTTCDLVTVKENLISL
ncbi:hypothetical protein BT93_I0029 [Corymbia citriodora subsp. variegata]|nr:hypothetical protein BT93_I0029 [Corymbia citriodora subsp. variegata]